MDANIHRVGLPTWSEDDQALARAVQKEIRAPMTEGLALELEKMDGPLKDEDKRGGGSDDIGDISWTVPTITLRYPANIQGSAITKYVPFLERDTPPPTWLNADTLERYRPDMRKYYYDPTRYANYLEQLGIKYPTVR
jgi:aminobenzoyl-glutamate utilization protein B